MNNSSPHTSASLAEDKPMSETDVALGELGAQISEVEAAFDDFRNEIRNEIADMRTELGKMRRWMETGET